MPNPTMTGVATEVDFILDAIIFYIHIMFMSATLTAAPTERSGPAGQTERLLGVVRALIAFGRHLAEALQQRDPTENPIRLIRHFGVATVAEIVARVAYALRLAMVLEMRLSQRLSRLATVRAAASAPAPARQRAKSAPRAKRDPDADEPPPEPLPSVEELAHMIRNRPVGDVIVDICRDFGIAANHPLWRRVYDVLLIEPTNCVVRLARDIVNRRHASWTFAPLIGEETVEAEFWPPALRLGTGPP